MRLKSFLFGLVAFVCFIGVVSATTYECNSCASCQIAIDGSSPNDTVMLNSSFQLPTSICLNVTDKDDLTIDCDGYSMNSEDIPEIVYMEATTADMTVTLKNCNLNCAGIANYGINIAGLSGFNTQALISNTTVSFCVVDGILFSDSGNGSIISDSFFINNTLRAMESVESSYEVENITIDNVVVNHIGNFNNGIQLDDSNYITVKNSVVNCFWDGVNGISGITTGQHSILSNDTINGCNSNPISPAQNVSANGIYVNNGNDASQTYNNYFNGSFMFMHNVSSSIINSGNISISHSYFLDSLSYGLYIRGVGVNKVINNLTSSGNNYGLFFQSSAENVIFMDSFISDSTTSAFYAQGTTNHTANFIYNNIFNDSIHMLADDTSTAYASFNTTRTAGTNIVGGSELGGNYWAYPNGTGYSQTCDNSDNDSFCDLPYTIYGINVDYLPLTTNYTYDTTPPQITIVEPQNTTYPEGNRNFNVTIDELAESICLSVDENVTYPVCATNTTVLSGFVASMTNGNYHFIFQANDSAGNYNWSDVYFTVDGAAPTITITSPTNTTYSTISINIQVSANSPVNTWWYNLNGTNVTFTPNITITAAEGSYNLFIYANDTVGNVGFESVDFTISLPTPPLINNLRQFSLAAGIIIGAGFLFFLMDALLSGALTDPKNLAAIIIGALIMIGFISVLFI